ncbi:F-type H+-transporting ATPase subunit a [Natranaerovirga hydrolytica]|uniref:ATP synthase subunit a n=1 Tax=Natranaerovirga hydrolytica TaxID=680378 RepID=A0A4R1M6M7_9FIRM|nr:F0F1 ATP synthase subunit A [Natranaerovirga hydrolytica]TCK87906.1 F-type H+-transporting ATPase subunit a [Natranaerovirga hydrolytica]
MTDFTIEELFVINIGDIEWMIGSTHFSVLMISLFLIGFSIYVNRRFKRFQEVPTGLQNFVEMVIELFDKFAVTTMGQQGKKFASYFLTLFVFLIISNLSGLVLLRPPTADYAVPLGLAIISFFMFQYYGIKAKGVGGYLKGLTEPIVFLTPINVIGELANPVSLSFRLFGNIIGGTVLLSLYYSTPWFMNIGIPGFLHFYFDIFAGLLQAFVFTILSMVLLTGAME